MLSMFQWLEATYASVIDSSFANAIHLSVWLFALTEAAHLLALAVVGCAVLIVDLRVLGLGLTRQPVAHVAREVRPWLLGSLAGMASTGVVMFVSAAASKYYSHPAFWLKMWLLAAALTLTFTVRQWIVSGNQARADGLIAKVVAAVSVLLWTSVAVMGRAGLGYY
jgi:Ca2+/H+ antiporter